MASALRHISGDHPRSGDWVLAKFHARTGEQSDHIAVKRKKFVSRMLWRELLHDPFLLVLKRVLVFGFEQNFQMDSALNHTNF